MAESSPSPRTTIPPSSFVRLRRLRRTHLLRDIVSDTRLHPDQLIYPVFVGELQQPRDVSSMPGVKQWPVEAAVKQIKHWRKLGLKQFLLFGVTPASAKNPHGTYACDPLAPVNRVLAMVRRAKLDVVMYADTCLCEYTQHGHCGSLDHSTSPPAVHNDLTLHTLAQVAVAQARAGADVVAPSAMMDGQVAALRQALDQADFAHVPILAYSVKFASNFYGPFREAGQGGMTFGDRKGYQMDYRRSREWKLELQADLDQGADMVMVKPAASYLDIVHQVRQACAVPVVAYHVSGEYAMLHAAAERGWLDLPAVSWETTLAIRRAGADLIITYFAPDLVRNCV